MCFGENLGQEKVHTENSRLTRQPLRVCRADSAALKGALGLYVNVNNPVLFTRFAVLTLIDHLKAFPKSD